MSRERVRRGYFVKDGQYIFSSLLVAPQLLKELGDSAMEHLAPALDHDAEKTLRKSANGNKYRVVREGDVNHAQGDGFRETGYDTLYARYRIVRNR